MKNQSLILTGILSTLLLCHCSEFTLKQLDHPQQPLPKKLTQLHQSEPGYRAYNSAYQLIVQARAMEKTSPQGAVGRYLEAADLASNIKDEALLPLYNHAVGQAAHLLVHHPGLREVQGSNRRYKIEHPGISAAAARRGELGLLEFKDVMVADTLKLKGWRHRVARRGVGSALVAHYQPVAAKRRKEDKFIGKGGVQLPVTVVVDFSKAGVARFETYDTTVQSEIDFWGKKRLLSVDLTASMAVSLEKARTRGVLEDIRGVFYPVRYENDLGLYSVQKFDRRKIPLILVHGLVSDPSTWSTTLNGLVTDQDILARYQIYFFYYPTGLPIRRTGSALKKDLLDLQAFYRSMGASTDSAVIVGHSMGGLLTSMQVRNYGEETWRKISTIPLKKAHLRKQVKTDYRTLIQMPRPKMIDRAVFIATPHRGSQMANDWIGRVVISLIKIPQQALKLDPIKASRSLTELGRTILLNDDMTNGVQALKNNNPALKLVASTPVAKGVKYHSIIGDRGKGDSPNSSDGVVEYRSSQLKGADSEVIVPSGHSAHVNPEAIKELRRILRLNLRAK